MRNLKRALSLTLASVMLLGMMVVGTSAASYPDVTEEHNVEAIEVLQAVGVMSGSDSGNFNPDSQVSRIEMAVVMSNLLNLKVDYFENQCRFTDVPAWAGKYVAACEASGIVSGIGNNQFGTGNVTATQAALMMLKALGYFQYASDFAGGWEQETAKLAANLSLFKGLDSVYNTTELTRNQVAQLALNTLKTPVVVPEDNTLTVSGQGSGVDFTINGGKVAYKVTASSDAYARAISSVEGSDANTITGIAGYVIELGEKLYDGKLQLRENGRDGATVYDDFGRPARKWQYDGTTFGTYPKKEELRKEYTVKVTGKDLYDELGSDIVRSIEDNGQWKLNVTIDGEETKTVLDGVEAGTYFSIASIKRTNTDAVGKTGKGVLTQVYVDSVHHLVDIAIINTYLAIADQDYNEKDDDVDLTVYHINEYGTSGRYVKNGPSNKAGDIWDGEETIAAKGDRLDIKDVKEDDKFLVTIAQGEIQSMVAPEIVSETTLNSFKKTDWVKNDDAQYDYASTAQYDDEVLDEYDAVNMKDVTYNVILDKYGYLIGLELNEGVAQYAFLTGVDLGESNLSAKNATGNLIFLDGTMKTVTINVEKSEYAAIPKVKDTDKPYSVTGGGADLSDLDEGAGDLYITKNTNTPNAERRYAQMNTWCTYTVDDDNVYTLKQVGSYSQARTDSNNGGPVRNAKKVAQSYINVDALTTSDVKEAGKLTINNKNTSLLGTANGAAAMLKPEAKKNDGTTAVPGGDFQYVYGNNDTVYINLKLKAVNVKGGDKLAIVDKVDSAVTGISNVDFTVTNVATTMEGLAGSDVPVADVYTLYNDKGYAIGVVTMNATDNGTSSHFAYITKEVSQEDFMGGSTWRWHVDAIVDGVKVQLTEANDSMTYLKNMKPGEWYSVTYDKDGNVNGIKSENTWPSGDKNKPINFDWAPVAITRPYADKFVTDVAEVRRATNGMDNGAGTAGDDYSESNSTVLLYRDYRCNVQDIDGNTNNDHNNTNAVKTKGYMKVEGDTLWTSVSRSEGIRISPNTKTVLILSKGHNTDTFDVVTDGFEGAEGLDKALKTLKTDTVGGYTEFDGVLTAVFKDGVATSIILEDESGNGHSGIVENVKPMTLTVTINFDDGSAPITRTVYWRNENNAGLIALIGTVNGYVPDASTLIRPSFDENGSGNASITFNKGTGAKVTKPSASDLTTELPNSGATAGVASGIHAAASGARLAMDGSDVVVTGTLQEASQTVKDWYNGPHDDYVLPLTFEAPYGVNASKISVKRDGETTVSHSAITGNKETIIVGLDANTKGVELEITWEDASGDELATSTMIVDLNGVTYAGSSSGAGELEYILNFKLSATEKFQKMNTVDLEGKTMAAIDAATVQAVLDEYNTENHTYWKVASTYATKYVSASNNTTPIDVPIEWETVKLKAPTALGLSVNDLKVAWDKDDDKGITAQGATDITDAGVDVPKGYDLAISGNKAGKYDKDGTRIDTMNLIADKTLTADDFGYYKVTMSATTVSGTPTGLTVGAPTLVNADDSGAVYIKADGNVTVNVAVTATQAINAVTLRVTVVDGTASAQQTLTGTAAALTLADTESGNVVVTVSGASDLTEDIIIGTITLAD